jgi:benzoate-CoA ligase family protein
MNLFDAIFTGKSLAATALRYEQRRINYGDLREQTMRIAAVFSSLDLAPGDRVAILLHDSPEFITSFISICSSGAIAVPINMALGLDEQRTILNDCNANVAVVESELCSTLLTDAPEKLRHLREVLAVDRREGTEESIRESEDQLKESRGSSASETVRVRLLSKLLDETKGAVSVFPPTDEDAPAVILYTSGSTGEPKGAIHRQADIFYTNETFCRQVLRLRAGDRLFSSSRLAFAYGLGNSLSFPLLNGMTTILCREKPLPSIISRIFKEDKPTIFFGVPVVYSLLLDYYRHVGELDCSSLRLCISAGEALPAQLGAEWEKTFAVPLLDGIGSTEMMHMFMSNYEGEVRYGSSGKVLKGYEAALRDEQDNPTPLAAEGNLWVKGASAARGYWQRPEATAQTFVDGWVRTGDLYRCDKDGYWFHMGRSDDCFKSSGRWVSPVEVEGVLLRHQGISRAAVVESFDGEGLPCPCAFVVCEDVESDSVQIEEGLRQLTNDALPRFKRPRRYLFVRELPYTATGKVQRFKLREQLREQRGAAAD